MISLALGSPARVTFSLSDTADSTPTVQCYAGSTLLGSATVSSLGGTRNYEATYTLPGSGIDDGTVIEFRVDADVASDPIATTHLIAGVVGQVSKLTGPHTVTITVIDTETDDPIEFAKVRLYRTGETETKETDDEGIAEFTIDDATWSVAVTADGYNGASDVAIVNGTSIGRTVEMTARQDPNSEVGWLG